MEPTHSPRLSKIARRLLNVSGGKVDAYSFAISVGDVALKTVVCTLSGPSSALLKGTGTAESASNAFLKALVELGEAWLVSTNYVKNRNGVAGGLLVHSAASRAKAELLERDAFLYHYRSGTPFRRKLATKKILGYDVAAFEMYSADPSFCTIFATLESFDPAINSCLLAGIGAHASLHVAIHKAFREFAMMAIDHRLRSGWCEGNLTVQTAANLADFHHAKSRDSRNLERIRRLCDTNEKGPGRIPRHLAWNQVRLPSPLRFIRYVKVECTELHELKFGVPEPKDIWGSDEPLFHPIW